MKLMTAVLSALLLTLGLTAIGESTPKYLLTKAQLEQLTPDEALDKLKAGNGRFIDGQKRNYDWVALSKYSAKGQYPMAIVLACVDSRSAPTYTFDQGLGNIFAARTAGNVSGTDVLGSMEFATKFAGSKLIVVMGHTRCGAIVGACENVKSGNLTALLAKIQPAVNKVKSELGDKFSCSDPKVIDEIAKQNVINQIRMILQNSPTITKLVKDKKIKIIGAMHDLVTRQVEFFDMNGNVL